MSARAQRVISHSDHASTAQRTIDDDVERALQDLPLLQLSVLRERFNPIGRPRAWRDVARRLGLSLGRVRKGVTGDQ